MAIKLDQDTQTYTVSFSRRHPVTRKPHNLRRKGFKTKSSAKREYAKMVVELERKFNAQIYPVFSTLLEQYIESLRRQITIGSDERITLGTIYKREKTLRRHTSPIWDDKCINQITGSEIRELIESTLDSYSEAHRKFILKGVRDVFQYAVEKGIIDRNPTPRMKFKIRDRIMSVLNEEQIQVLLQRAKEQDWEWYPHYAMALGLGLRSGELYALPWENVFLNKRLVLVNCSWSSKDGFKSTKSGHDRMVEIPSPLIPVLNELKMDTCSTGFVLPRLYKWEQGEQARMLRLFLQSNGLPEVRFHDLRASWATLLLSKGVAPSKVMSMGGWADMKTMMVYMRKAGIDIKGSTSCLDDMNFHSFQSGKVLDFKSSSEL